MSRLALVGAHVGLAALCSTCGPRRPRRGPQRHRGCRLQTRRRRPAAGARHAPHDVTAHAWRALPNKVLRRTKRFAASYARTALHYSCVLTSCYGNLQDVGLLACTERELPCVPPDAPRNVR